MAEITVYLNGKIGQKHQEIEIKGMIYEYIEAGRDENLRPGFHISAHSPDHSSSSIFYMTFDDMEEYKNFLIDLKKQIEKK
ncbi:MAG: hypothetical protein AABW56_02865 [Nanoarchaeota archaeon]